jgi:branched-chain amino acid transport system ATP-binding protein
VAPLLELQSVSKRFGGLAALAGVSFPVHQGQILGLIGPNGAGKTTLFNCITGVYAPTDGAILFSPQDKTLRTNGYKPEKMTALGIARTFQNIRLFNALTVLDNVRIARHCRTRSNFLRSVLRTPFQKAEESAIVEEAMRWLMFVGLGGMPCPTPPGSPTAISAAWRSRAPWPPSLDCFCWMNRRPA